MSGVQARRLCLFHCNFDPSPLHLLPGGVAALMYVHQRNPSRADVLHQCKATPQCRCSTLAQPLDNQLMPLLQRRCPRTKHDQQLTIQVLPSSLLLGKVCSACVLFPANEALMIDAHAPYLLKGDSCLCSLISSALAAKACLCTCHTEPFADTLCPWFSSGQHDQSSCYLPPGSTATSVQRRALSCDWD